MENMDRLLGYRVAFVIDHGTSSITGQHILMKTPFASGEVTEENGPIIRFCEKAQKYIPLNDLMNSILD